MYMQIYIPTMDWYKEAWMKPLPSVFDMLQYFQTSFLLFVRFDIIPER